LLKVSRLGVATRRKYAVPPTRMRTLAFSTHSLQVGINSRFTRPVKGQIEYIPPETIAASRHSCYRAGRYCCRPNSGPQCCLLFRCKGATLEDLIESHDDYLPDVHPNQTFPVIVTSGALGTYIGKLNWVTMEAQMRCLAPKRVPTLLDVDRTSAMAIRPCYTKLRQCGVSQII
jgi:hypothetical protein